MADDIGDIKNEGEPQAGQERQGKQRKTIDHGILLRNKMGTKDVRSGNFSLFKFAFYHAVIETPF